MSGVSVFMTEVTNIVQVVITIERNWDISGTITSTHRTETRQDNLLLIMILKMVLTFVIFTEGFGYILKPLHGNIPSDVKTWYN